LAATRYFPKAIIVTLLLSFAVLIVATVDYSEYNASGSNIRSTNGTIVGNLNVTIRDFKLGHPDFESGEKASERDIVLPTLGSDKKPQYNENTTSITTNGKQFFDQWYNDVYGINQRKNATLTLTQSPDDPRVHGFSFSEFFPIDNELFGNEGSEHNYHFTTEIHSQIRYQGGENLTITGDDDVWVFINNQLVIDLGGVHPDENQTINLDSLASAIGIVPGNIYNIDIFQAERQREGSVFSLVYQVSE
jgi:fibro-slime domain-containing protein